MHIDVLFAGVPTADFDIATDWYTRLLGRPADVTAHATEVMWHCAANGWLYVVLDPERAGKSLVALCVADLEEAVAAAAARGVGGKPIHAVGGGSERKAVFTDPDGNCVALIEVPAATEH